MATVSVKRKRGRPRRDEPPEINEFDISLIREFANRPAFYDRSCVHYRNRDYLDLQWEEMAQKLGYNVTLIKDRMMQLRNRYNLEKRRVDTLQTQYNDSSIKSQWPLFGYLSFLGDYIKSRRPYRYTTKCTSSGNITQKNNTSNSSSETDDYEESQNNSCNDTESDHQQPVANNFKLKPLVHSTINHESQSNVSSRGPTPTPTTVQKNECHQPQKHKHTSLEVQAGRKVFNERLQLLSAEKYKAFGQFLAASLIEMNELDALALVNKFTTELVRSMHSDFRAKSAHNNKNNNNNNNNTSDNASDSVEISI